MKIESNNLYHLLQSTQNQGSLKNPAASVPAQTPQAGETGTQDRVRLSAAARELQAQEQHPYDKQRVESLRAAIGNGQYQVDSQAIAQKLLAYTQLDKKD